MTLKRELRGARGHPLTRAAARVGAALERAMRAHSTRPCQLALLKVVVPTDNYRSVRLHVDAIHRSPSLSTPRAYYPSRISTGPDELASWERLTDVDRLMLSSPGTAR